LYNAESNNEKSKKMLSSCLRVNRNYSLARDAIKRLQGLQLDDWYRWWFGYGKVKKDNWRKLGSHHIINRHNGF
jgi:hypothetical protein